MRVPTTWLIAGYALVFVAFVRVLGLGFADLSPIPLGPSLDPRLLRFIVIEPQARDAKVRYEATPAAISVEASGLRSPGLTISIEAPLIEAPCAMAKPHVHSAAPGAEELELSFEAQAIEPNTRLRVGVSEPAPDPAPRRLRWSEPLEISHEWRAFQVTLRDMLPPARPDARPGAVASILLRPLPIARSALRFRHFRLLRVANVKSTPRPVE